MERKRVVGQVEIHGRIVAKIGLSRGFSRARQGVSKGKMRAGTKTSIRRLGTSSRRSLAEGCCRREILVNGTSWPRHTRISSCILTD